MDLKEKKAQDVKNRSRPETMLANSNDFRMVVMIRRQATIHLFNELRESISKGVFAK